jgi:hypothetical protein
VVSVSSTPLLDQHGRKVINASGVLPVGPSLRFVFIVNTGHGSLFELNLNPDGTQDGPTVPRRIVGLAADALSDPEGIARIDTDGAIDLIVASSLSVDIDPSSGTVSVNDGLVRIRYTPAGDLHAQAMPGFRDWLLAGYPALTEAAQRPPDDDGGGGGGLNIEGLAWDPSRRALLFGIRSPVTAGRIPVLCVHLDIDAPWSTAALQVGPSLWIEKSDFVAPQGIRDIDYDAARKEFLVIVGRSISGGDAPFQLCTWDGTASVVNVLDVTFEPPASSISAMKPEGVTAFSGDSARKILIVDDAGGFATLNTI